MTLAHHHLPGAISDAPDPVAPEVLEDLQRRLRSYRRVVLPGDLGWARGMDADYLADLVSYWATRYDWRPHEHRIRSWPWVRTRHSRIPARAVHQLADHPAAPTVVLLHGWPDSVLRFERVLPLLTDLHIVVPCLPGYPFAEPLTEAGISVTAMAEVVADLMTELGHDRYIVSGGDIGSSVGEALAAAHPEHVMALHLTDVPYRHLFTLDDTELSPEERDHQAAGQRWQLSEGAYALEQSTKPHTLAVALGDSPAGLAAWLIEKLRTWSDCAGDVEAVFPREDLLTWVTTYWVTGTIGTSFSPYIEPARQPTYVDVPTAVTLFPKDLVPAPRQLAERFFDLQVWDEQPSGGHFAAWERPEAFTAGVRAAVALAAR